MEDEQEHDFCISEKLSQALAEKVACILDDARYTS